MTQAGYTRMEKELKNLKSVERPADIIDVKAMTGDAIKFGATVTVVDEDTEEKITYQIVGDYEADIKRNLISTSAPIGRALIGKKRGASVEVITPKGARFYEVLRVEYV